MYTCSYVKTCAFTVDMGYLKDKPYLKNYQLGCKFLSLFSKIQVASPRILPAPSIPMAPLWKSKALGADEGLMKIGDWLPNGCFQK